MLRHIGKIGKPQLGATCSGWNKSSIIGRSAYGLLSKHSIQMRNFHQNSSKRDEVDEFRLRHIFDEVNREYQRRYEEKYGRSSPKMVLSVLLALAVVFGISMEGVFLSDQVNHQNIQGDLNKLLNEHAKNIKEQRVTNKGDSGNTVLKGVIMDSPKDNWLEKLKKDMQRYPVMYGIMALNFGVFALLRTNLVYSPRFALFFSRHMSLSAHNFLQGRVHTLLTSTFVHIGWLHLGFNMYALNLMGGSVYDKLGGETFLAFYLAAGAAASMGSVLLKFLTRQYFRGSIGASGSIFALLLAGIAVDSFEKSKIHIMFLEDFGGFSAKYFFPCYFAGEILYNIFSKTKLDTAAHMTGALFGYLAFKLLMQKSQHQTTRKVEVTSRNYYYLGDVKEFKREGNGLMRTSTGPGYMGGFHNGVPEGVGMVFGKDDVGRPFSTWAEFKDGQFVRQLPFNPSMITKSN